MMPAAADQGQPAVMAPLFGRTGRPNCDADAERRHRAAAYEVGQLLNRLRFFAIQAWMLGRWDVLENENSYQRLPRVARGCLDGVAQQENLGETIERRLDDIASIFWHDEHFDCNCLLGRRLAQFFNEPTGESEESLLHEAAQEVIRTPMGLAAQLRDQIDVQIAEPLRSVIRLAAKIDEAARPQSICREALDDALEFWGRERTPIGRDWVELLSHVAPTGPAVVWPTELRTVSRRRPQVRWLDQVRDLCRLNGAPLETINPLIENLSSFWDDVLFDSDVYPMSQAVESIHCEVRRALGLDVALFLGMRFDDANLRITRDGFPHAVEFRRQLLPYHFIKFLAERGAQYTNRQSLRGRWPNFGGTPDPENSTIDNVKSRVRLLLAPLQVVLVAQFPRGFRLESQGEAMTSRD
jgi:hypothetical protein